MKRPLAIAALVLLGTAPARADYQLEPAFPYVSFLVPTDLQAPPDGTQRLFVVEKFGTIQVFPAYFTAQPGDVVEFLNITSKVRSSGEAGLLGLAFHPNYRTNRYFYVFYVSTFPYRAILARYRVSADPNVADPLSETILLDVPKSSVYHNGGQIVFGPDGYLYVGLGDDSAPESAQDLGELGGSILRIDVDTAGTPGEESEPLYEIPADNPFAGNSQGFREEVFAYGLRNPWRFSVDRYSGELWVADVGEDTYEEINLVDAGLNYDWPYMEGPACLDEPACQQLGGTLVAPYYSYGHNEGVAVIGGQRYWGSRVPELAGLYIFADYTGGTVWGLRNEGAGQPVERFDLVENAPSLLTFGTAPNGELLAASAAGVIYRLGRVVTGVGDGATPPSHRLLGNHPNPFNPSTTIRYQLASPGRVLIEIVSVTGERVRRIDEGRRPTGTHALVWKGETERHSRAASGVYFYRLVVDGVSVDGRRMVLVE
jgi:glucose/arabinose dehydrogenase